ncbi:MAG: hypothetical protein AB1403_18615 [Candidatus Riflebacteria bacterium]
MRSFKSCIKVGLMVAVAFAGSALDAAQLSGSVSVTRNNARQIVGAILTAGGQEYEIVMDENGKSLAQMYEHKDLKVECAIDGKKITVETWQEIKSAASSAPAYNEPEPRDDPPPEDEPSDEPKDDEPSDEEPKDEEPSDEEPKDEEPKDEEPKDEEPKDEEPKDEEPKDEEPSDDEPKEEEPKEED